MSIKKLIFNADSEFEVIFETRASQVIETCEESESEYIIVGTKDGKPFEQKLQKSEYDLDARVEV